MTDKAAPQEELMAMREKVAKAWKAGRDSSGDDARSAALAAYLDREYPLPAPEPQQVTGPSGWTWELTACSLDMRRDGRAYGLTLPPEDRATVANLLVPFEDVVRATLEESIVRRVDTGDAESRAFFLERLTQRLPAILKRLASR